MRRIIARCLITGSALSLLPAEAFAALPVKLQCDSTGQAVARSAGVPEQMIQRFMVEPAQRGRAYYESHEIAFPADFPYVPEAGTSKSAFQFVSYAWRTMNYFLVKAADALPNNLEGLKRYNQLDAAMQYYNACIDLLDDDNSRNRATFVRGPVMLDIVEPQLRAMVTNARGNRAAEIQILRDYFSSTRVRWSAYESGWPVPYLPEALNGSNLIAAFNQSPPTTSVANNRDEASGRTPSQNNGYPPGVVATPPKGTIIDPPQGNAASRTASAASHARPATATTSSGMPTADEIASVYARAAAANSNGYFRWIGGNTVVAIQPMLNLEMGRYEYRITPSSVKCTKGKARGHRCNYTVTQVAVRGQGLSGMTAAFSGGVRPTVTTRADQFERSASGLASSSLNRAWASTPRTASTSADDRRRQAEQEEHSRQSQEAWRRQTLGCDNAFNPNGPPPGC